MMTTVSPSAVLPPLLFDDSVHRAETLCRLNTLRRNGQFCDVVIEVGRHSVPAHRAVLASASLCLFELFATADETSQQSYVILEKVDYDSFEILLNYAYTSRMEVPADMVKSVYRSATWLKMHQAAEACSHYLADNLTPANCLETRAFASSHSDGELTSKTDAYIQNHMDEVMQSAAVCKLPRMLIDIMGVTEDELMRRGEKHLCRLVVDWLQQSADKSQLAEMCENPHILYLTSDNNLRDCLHVDDLTLNNTDVIQDYKRLNKHKQMATKGGHKDKSAALSSSPPHSLRPLERTVQKEWKLVATRMLSDRSCICVTMLDDCLHFIALSFHPYPTATSSSGSSGSEEGENCENVGCDTSLVRQCSLEPLAPMSSARCAVGTAVLQNQLIVLGGYDRGECLNLVEVYDADTNTWTSLPPLLSPRGRLDVSQLQGKLYACGGSNGSEDLRSAECYDPLQGKWTALPDMLSERSSPGVIGLDNKLYVIGGWQGSRGVASCEVYDPVTGIWSAIASMQQGRSQSSVCALNGRLVAAGGCDAWNCTNLVEVYDPVLDTWSFLPSMANSRRGAGAAIFQGKLYAVGGSDGHAALQTVEVFEPAFQMWSSGPSLGVPRANVGVAVVGSRLFAVGGFNGKTFLDSIEYLAQDRHEWCNFVPATSIDSSMALVMVNEDYSPTKDEDSRPIVVNGDGCGAMGSNGCSDFDVKCMGKIECCVFAAEKPPELMCNTATNSCSDNNLCGVVTANGCTGNNLCLTELATVNSCSGNKLCVT